MQAGFKGSGPAAAAFAFAAILFGCGSGPQFSARPTITANPNAAVPQAAVVRFEANGLVRTTLTVSDGDRSWELVYGSERRPEDGLAVVGMKADRDHRIEVRIENETGTATADALSFRTPPLPDDPDAFPPLRLAISQPQRMEPGFTVFNPRRSKAGDLQFGTGFGMLIAVDHSGDVLWYYRTDARISDFERLRNGNLIFVTHDHRLVEIDWLGNVQRQWYAGDRPDGPVPGAVGVAGTVSFHHEVDELANGNLVVLGSEIRELENWYSSETDPGAPRQTQRVMGDIILEFDAETGEVAWEWRAFDALPTDRLAYETFDGYWTRRGFPEVKADWSHANNVIYDEADDAYLINFRYQAAIVKIDRATKQIEWILAGPDGWGELADRVLQPVGDTRLPYHQHSPQPTPQGTLLVFDNGNYQARPFDKPAAPSETYSRAVEYRIDEEAGSVEQLWQSEEKNPASVVSYAMGDVDWQHQTGNVLAGYGYVIARDEIASGEWQWTTGGRSAPWTMVREYARGAEPGVVWEVVVDGSDRGIGWALFGVERYPSWTPARQDAAAPPGR